MAVISSWARIVMVGALLLPMTSLDVRRPRWLTVFVQHRAGRIFGCCRVEQDALRGRLLRTWPITSVFE